MRQEVIAVLSLAIAYLIGSIPTGLWVGRLIYKRDLHAEGSGATGTTNSVRILGKKAGLFVFVFDFLKALIPALLTQALHIPVNPFLVALFAILGHCYPIFANFKGGKAVATTFGFFLVFIPLPTLLGLITFIVTLLLSSMISLGSVLASSIVFLTIIFALKDPVSIWSSFIILFIMIYRHKSNIQRIIKKTENKVPLTSKHKKILIAIIIVCAVIAATIAFSTYPFIF